MDAAVIVIAAVSIALLLAAAVWTDRRYARFARLPTHFDLRGRADAFGPRMVILWVVSLRMRGSSLLRCLRSRRRTR